MAAKLNHQKLTLFLSRFIFVVVCVYLKVVCLALFDAALVHAMNSLSPPGEWLVIKRRLCDALFVNKQVCASDGLVVRALEGC